MTISELCLVIAIFLVVSILVLVNRVFLLY